MLVVNGIEAMYYASKDSNRNNGDRKKQKPVPIERHNNRGQSFETVLLNYIHQIKIKKGGKEDDEH